MKTILKLLCLFLCILFLNSASEASIKVKEYIRVGVLCGVLNCTVASDKDYKIISENGKLNLSAGKADIRLAGRQVIIGKKNFSLPLTVKGPSLMVVNNKWYRGSLFITMSKDNKLNVINIVKTEDYLKGILPKEASSSWPIEALKAQAVISRSYVINNLNKHSRENFDVCSQVHCQVYGGAGAETKKCNEAVVKTAGEVVVYDKKIAQTVFHSNCGGYTEDPKYVWGWASKTPVYLKGIKDKYCKNSPNYSWQCSIPEETIRTKLIKAGYKIGKISSVKTSGNTPGHAKAEIIIKHAKGTLKINSYKFRTSVDPWKIKSHMISSVKKKKSDFVFSGNGWGHKVGLCQWGCKVMADKGFGYKEILRFYYPGTSLSSVEYNGK